MTKIDIFSGFLGAGKTTLIKKLIAEGYSGERLVLIENEFGEIGIDGGFLADAGINITEMNSGCICCSLVGDFSRALAKVLEEYHPDRILIEPSGVGKLSDVVRAVQGVANAEMTLSTVTVVDAGKCKMYLKNFGEFFGDQVEHAGTVVLSHTKGLSEEKIHTAVELCRARNPEAVIVTTDWEELTGAQLLAAIERRDTLSAAMADLKAAPCPVCGHHHDHEHHHHDEHHEHHHHDEHCECHEHEHHHDEHCECHEHEHHHHDEHEHHHHDEHEHHHHDEHCECHEHEHHHHDEHHHEHGEHCTCGCHDHDHHDHHDHHHHHADEVFVSYGAETPKTFTKEGLEKALAALSNYAYGTVLRAKGIVKGESAWLHFDYVPGEGDVREGAAGITGRLCVIGADLDREALSALFGVELH